MGLCRTLHTTLACQRCGVDHAVDVQFKTGDDRCASEYRPGGHAYDLAPEVFEGIADAYCATCSRLWVEEEKHAHFELLAADVEAHRIVARRATWRHGVFDGRPELGLVVTLLDAEPVSADAIRALAETPEGFGWPTFTARLHTASIAIWLGDVRLFPSDPSHDAASTEWWKRRREDVNAQLRGLGWPGGDNQWVEIGVRVDADHRVTLAR
jgi:hypothetical protein